MRERGSRTRQRALAGLAAAAAAVAMSAWVTSVAARQGSSGAETPQEPMAEEWTPPPPREVPARTPDGQPNLQDVWSYTADYTPLERPARFAGREFLTPDEQQALINARNDSDYQTDPGVHYDFTEWGLDKWQTGVVRNPRTSVIVDPPDGRLPPLTPEAQQRSVLEDGRWRSRDPVWNPYWKAFPKYDHLDLSARCVTGMMNGGAPMVRPGNGAHGEMEILQTPTHIVIFNDSNNDTRIISLDGRPRLATTKWFGDSHGRWEGETLVVETTNFRDQSLALDRFLIGKDMRLTERLTRISPDLLRYQFTVEDPSTWTKPWSGEVLWPRVGGAMYEAACHDENYSVLNVLKGEKATEEATRAQAGK